MSERVVTFGPGGILVGVLTEPDELHPDRPVVVMWNVGLNHRVGPSRVWVELARRLATQGVASLRFDLSGLGDSAPRRDLLNDVERAVLDLEDALDWLAERFPPCFVLVSNCSGTDNAHVVARRDPRVAGAVFLDGYSYTTPRHRFNQSMGRFVSARHWKRLLRRRFPAAFGLELDRSAAGAFEEIYTREYPARARFETDLATMVDRGARLLFVFSGETSYSYERQFWHWLRRKDWGGRIAVEFYRNANHTYSYRADREILLHRMTRWVTAMD